MNATPYHLIQSDTDKVAELLIKNGANVNALDVDNDTPLHWAAQYGNL